MIPKSLFLKNEVRQFAIYNYVHFTISGDNEHSSGFFDLLFTWKELGAS